MDKILLDMNKTIWILWLQGWENAPKLVQHCLRSWERHNPEWTIHALDSETLSAHVDVSDFRALSERITPQAWSDIIRMHLLREQGGVWVDATCFCCRPLDGWLPDRLTSGFFAFERPGEDRLISSWFLAAVPGNRLVDTYCREVRDYWLNNPGLRLYCPWDEETTETGEGLRKLLDNKYVSSFLLKYPTLWFSFLFTKVLKIYPYYVFHYRFEYCYKRDSYFRAVWDATPKISADIPHTLQHVGLLNPLSDAVRQDIDQRVAPLYKLTWKLDETKITPGCVLDYLLGCQGTSTHTRGAFQK